MPACAGAMPPCMQGKQSKCGTRRQEFLPYDWNPITGSSMPGVKPYGWSFAARPPYEAAVIPKMAGYGPRFLDS